MSADERQVAHLVNDVLEQRIDRVSSSAARRNWLSIPVASALSPRAAAVERCTAGGAEGGGATTGAGGGEAAARPRPPRSPQADDPAQRRPEQPRPGPVPVVRRQPDGLGDDGGPHHLQAGTLESRISWPRRSRPPPTASPSTSRSSRGSSSTATTRAHSEDVKFSYERSPPHKPNSTRPTRATGARR